MSGIQYKFEEYTNIINNDLTIIKETNSGYYNVTHSRNIIHKLRVTNKPNIKTKLTKNWFLLKDSPEVIEILKDNLNDNKLMFILGNEVDNKYRGTYVHKELYQHMLYWLDIKYCISIMSMIGRLQDEHNLSTKFLLKEKDCKIDKLSKQIDDQSKQIDDQSKQIAELLGYAKETKDELIDTKEILIKTRDELVDTKEEVLCVRDELNDTNRELTEVHDKVEEVREVVHKRNNHVNISPQNGELVHYFSLILSEPNKIRIISGQRMYVERTYESTYSKYELLVNCEYCPNPTSLKSRIKDKIKYIIDSKKENIIEDYNRNLISREYKTTLIRNLRTNPPLKLSYTILTFDNDQYNLNEAIDFLLMVNNERIELPVP